MNPEEPNDQQPNQEQYHIPHTTPKRDRISQIIRLVIALWIIMAVILAVVARL